MNAVDLIYRTIMTTAAGAIATFLVRALSGL